MFDTLLMILQQSDDGGASTLSSLISLIFGILVIAGWWMMFSKAGQPGWAAIIPIYNLYILISKVAGRPWWWLLLLLIPFVNFIILIIVWNDVSKAFGRGIGTTIGLIFLSPIFVLILGFGSAQFVGPGGNRMQ